MPTARPRNRVLVLGALVALAIATVVVAIMGVTRTTAAPQNSASKVNPVQSSSTMLRSRPTLLIVGDSFAGGVGDGTIPTYPANLADQMGWNLALDAQGGTGYINFRTSPPPATQPFLDRLAGDKAKYDPEYILVDGGRNDLDRPADQVLAAMRTYLTQLRAAYPRATVVVVVPSFMATTPAPDYPQLRDGITGIATDINAKVIDPVADGWYRTVDPAWFWVDGVHPGAEGGRYLADRLAASLRGLGLGDPRS